MSADEPARDGPALKDVHLHGRGHHAVLHRQQRRAQLAPEVIHLRRRLRHELVHGEHLQRDRILTCRGN
jgi:hypothetical protein